MPVGLYHMYPLGQKDGIHMTEPAAQPLYKYIKDDIVRQIKDGVYKPDQCLPSERDFCLIYGTTRMTVRHALNDLEVEGVVYRLQGKGTFVTGAKLVQPLMQVTGFTEDMQRRGKSPSSRLLYAGVQKANHVIASDLGIGLGQDYILIRRLRFADGVPLAIEETALSYHLCSSLLDDDIAHGSIYGRLRQMGIKLITGEQYMEATLADSEQAELLQIERGAAVMHIERHVCSEQGLPVEATYSTYRGDQYRFFVNFDSTLC